jgi:tRNA(Ile)-lysidine synthase
LSGGADSVALLVALAALRNTHGLLRGRSLRAVHVHHGLRPAADAWARYCRALCRKLGVSLSVRRVSVPHRRGRSLEAEARSARYAALAQGLRRGEWLLTAHHEDDQLETLLLQLLRGAGVAGLAGMPRLAIFEAGYLVRPLLGESRAALEHWLRARGVAWVDDDSNVDERFDRNYLRQRVVPLLRARWPAAAAVAARSAAHLGEARELLEVLAASDLQAVGVGVGVDAARLIDLQRLGKLSVARQRNLLRYWLRQRGLALPDAVHLERIRTELPAARRDAQPAVRWDGGEVRRFKSRLYALLPARAASAALATASASTPQAARNSRAMRRWHWRRQPNFVLDGGRGVLRLVADPQGLLAATALPATLRVGMRAGGERLVIESGGPRRALKELLRVAELPPWERAGLPLVYADELVAAGDLLVAAKYRALPGVTLAGERMRLVWEGRFC